ncbi:hypothetical protein ETAA8_53180 [Anatilimnocola aggregata]|uniref:Uncharacterized protein n=1 Tax=Anatilimnocola aggregata TaxID=2528021 RepID=A0A517YIZ6_9BACT|nr:hypothetical protein [Anatilimnocola aggregata]QDU30199.1 hypothetical protein ETAA8_53180 [Anatilimnocola aggregata]
MSIRNFFYQECPVCGRQLRIGVNHLGRELACSHCQGSFIARDPDIAKQQTMPTEEAPDSLSFQVISINPQSTQLGLPR